MHQQKHEEKKQRKESEKVDKILTEVQKKSEEYLAGWRRAQADYQNLKKEIESQKALWLKFAHDQLLTELLPVYDNFKISLAHVPENQQASQWVVGLTHIKNQLQKVLKDNGISEIKTIGEKFNPEKHEAIEAVESVEHKPDTIIEELKPGYMLHDKVIQVARVKVAKENTPNPQPVDR